MAMPSIQSRYTVAEVLAFPPDGNRYELIHGELLVSPAPRRRHQQVLGEFYALLYNYLAPLGRRLQLCLSPADITWDDETLVQPDVFVVSESETSGEWSSVKTLLLAIEVLSPSTARADRVLKRRLYQQQGVATYWIVDADSASVEVWHPGDERPEVVRDVLRWRVAEGAPEVCIDVQELLGDLPR
jgi:Uma2 family endonuclease